MSRAPFSLPLLFVLLISVLCASTAWAQPRLGCDLSSQPGATLLLPYFEVDLEDPHGPSTLFAVGNATELDTLAHAVVWTNWGHPVVSFDFFIEGRAVRSFNVRDLLQGRLPTTEPPATLPEGRYASCTRPLTLPEIDPRALGDLLRGRPSPADGLCYGKKVEDGRLATGYITIDTVNDCSGATLVTPHDASYFGDCATGLAANDNVLWGDFFLVDPSSDYAKGERLVVLTADQTRIGGDICIDPPCGDRLSRSFYDPDSNRMPLPWVYEARFLDGGGFDGGTELLVWVPGRVGPMNCAFRGTPPGLPTLRLEPRSERGVELDAVFVDTAMSTRLKVGGTELPLAERFGCLEISARGKYGVLQLWVMPLLSAEGRYSVGLGAVPIRDFCS